MMYQSTIDARRSLVFGDTSGDCCSVGIQPIRLDQPRTWKKTILLMTEIVANDDGRLAVKAIEVRCRNDGIRRSPGYFGDPDFNDR